MFWLAYKVFVTGAFSVKGVYSYVGDQRIAISVAFLVFGLFFLMNTAFLIIKRHRHSRQNQNEDKTDKN